MVNKKTLLFVSLILILTLLVPNSLGWVQEGEAPLGRRCEVSSCGLSEDCPQPGYMCRNSCCEEIGGSINVERCYNNNECSPTYSCVGGACRKNCNTAYDCRDGHVCDPHQGHCSMAPMPVGTPCILGERCGRGLYCLEGICEPSCEDNSQCRYGLVCNEGECVPPPITLNRPEDQSTLYINEGIDFIFESADVDENIDLLYLLVPNTGEVAHVFPADIIVTSYNTLGVKTATVYSVIAGTHITSESDSTTFRIINRENVQPPPPAAGSLNGECGPGSICDGYLECIRNYEGSGQNLCKVPFGFHCERHTECNPEFYCDSYYEGEIGRCVDDSLRGLGGLCDGNSCGQFIGGDWRAGVIPQHRSFVCQYYFEGDNHGLCVNTEGNFCLEDYHCEGDLICTGGTCQVPINHLEVYCQDHPNGFLCLGLGADHLAPLCEQNPDSQICNQFERIGVTPANFCANTNGYHCTGSDDIINTCGINGGPDCSQIFGLLLLCAARDTCFELTEGEISLVCQLGNYPEWFASNCPQVSEGFACDSVFGISCGCASENACEGRATSWGFPYCSDRQNRIDVCAEGYSCRENDEGVHGCWEIGGDNSCENFLDCEGGDVCLENECIDADPNSECWYDNHCLDGQTCRIEVIEFQDGDDDVLRRVANGQCLGQGHIGECRGGWEGSLNISETENCGCLADGCMGVSFNDRGEAPLCDFAVHDVCAEGYECRENEEGIPGCWREDNSCNSNNDCEENQVCVNNACVSRDSFQGGLPDCDDDVFIRIFGDEDEDEHADIPACDLCLDTPEDAEVGANGCALNVDDEETDMELFCEDEGGVYCGSGQCGPDTIGIKSEHLGDNLRHGGICCFPRNGQVLVGEERLVCQNSQFNPLTGLLNTVTESDCIDPDGDGYGTKHVDYGNGNVVEEACTTIPSSARSGSSVPFFGIISLILSLMIISAFYIKTTFKNK